MIGVFDVLRTSRHEIEKDQVDLRVGQHLSHGLSICRQADAKPLLGQGARNKLADLAMVIDDQDMRRLGHGWQFR